MSIRRAGWSSLVAAVLGAGCRGDAPPVAKEKPATVSNAQVESALTQVKLTTEAFTRLGIETVVVDSMEVGATRTLGGEVIAPPGERADVVAPVAGQVILEAGLGRLLGTTIAQGTAIMRIAPIPTGTDVVRSAEEVRITEARFAQANAEVNRVRALRDEKLVSEREFERAVADAQAAEAARDAAVARHRLAQTGAVPEPGTPAASNVLTALTIAAPLPGVLLDLKVGFGQIVTAGTPLFTVASLRRLWVRVPVYAGDAHAVSRQEPATVHGLSSGTGGFAVRARPVAAPLSADPTASSVDLYYQLDAPRGLRPGERVRITLPVQGQRHRGLAVPLAAVLYDVHGDTWVYVRTDSLVFTRRRIEIANIVGERALIARGLTRGAKVVTAGAVELFGTEFGPGK